MPRTQSVFMRQERGHPCLRVGKRPVFAVAANRFPIGQAIHPKVKAASCGRSSQHSVAGSPLPQKQAWMPVLLFPLNCYRRVMAASGSETDAMLALCQAALAAKLLLIKVCIACLRCFPSRWATPSSRGIPSARKSRRTESRPTSKDRLKGTSANIRVPERRNLPLHPRIPRKRLRSGSCRKKGSPRSPRFIRG